MADEKIHATAIDWVKLEEIRNALRQLHGMAYAVMIANDTEDIYLDAVAAVYHQAGIARELFEQATFPREFAGEVE